MLQFLVTANNSHTLAAHCFIIKVEEEATEDTRMKLAAFLQS
jgi:hypothetical protein